MSTRANVQFLALYLLSVKEERGLILRFRSPVTVLCAPNGAGKSSIMKTFYQVFGAQPPKIDQRWIGAKAISGVQFVISGANYTIVRAYDSFGVFDSNSNLLMKTSSVSKLSGWFQLHINFRLVMPNQEGKVVTPPPAYFLAPFYIDQDKGWSDPWGSFERLYLPRSKETLAEYHSGLKPNEYFEAYADRARLQLDADSFSREKQALDSALSKLESAYPTSLEVDFTEADFSESLRALTERLNELLKLQAQIKAKAALLQDERDLWANQAKIMQHAIHELGGMMRVAITTDDHVDCPTCGASYATSLADRFDLVRDEDELRDALSKALAQMKRLDIDLKDELESLDGVRAKLALVSSALEVRKGGISLDEVIDSRGRDHARRAFGNRIDEVTKQFGDAEFEVKLTSERMRKLSAGERAAEIANYMEQLFGQYLIELDVHADEASLRKVSLRSGARGSASPRALLAYRYALLHAAAKYGTQALWPIVIDAPNQQGQDYQHLPRMLRFIVDRAPPESQIVLATESGTQDSIKAHPEVEIVALHSEVKRQILQESMYADARTTLLPLVDIMLNAD